MIDFYFFPYCFKFLLFLLLLFRINFSLKYKRLSILRIFFLICLLSKPSISPNFYLKCFVSEEQFHAYRHKQHTNLWLTQNIHCLVFLKFTESMQDVVTGQKTKKWLTNSFKKAQDILKLAFKTSYTTAQKKFQNS